MYFNKFLKKIWPLFGLFSFLRIWPFLKLLMAKFGLFYFFGPGNPDVELLSNEKRRERERERAKGYHMFKISGLGSYMIDEIVNFNFF